MLEKEIINENKKLLSDLENEALSYNGFSNWYGSLEGFRNKMKEYVIYDSEHKIHPKVTKLENGHMIDHHAMGFLAPLEFKRIGFEGVERTPAEQLIYFNKQLKQHNIRFIYVALPCKKAVYPEIIDQDIVDRDFCVIPQWRKMLLELAVNQVEIIDMYPEFMKQKYVSDLFVKKTHRVSPYGIDIVSNKVADYLKKTSNLKSHPYHFVQTKEYIPWDFILSNVTKIKKIRGGVIYTGTSEESIDSEIMMIGNCNLQIYRVSGASIVANTSYHLNYPIRYGGRFLPFDYDVDCIEKMPGGLLKNIKTLLYIGFPSASFVRARGDFFKWSIHPIPDEVFG